MEARAPRPLPQPLSAKAYLITSAVVGAVALFLTILTRALGWEGKLLLFIVLLPWALCCAILLFGGMRATGTGKGKVLGVSFEFGGPAALFLLVMVAGYPFVRDDSPSVDIVVRALTPHQDDPPIKTGTVTLQAGAATRSTSFNENGEANFNGVLRPERPESVVVRPAVPGYARKRYAQLLPRSRVIEVRLEHAPPSNRVVKGIVTPPPGSTERVEVGAALVTELPGHQSEPTPENAPVAVLTGLFTIIVRSRETDSANFKVLVNGSSVWNAVHPVAGPELMLQRPVPSPQTAPPSVKPLSSVVQPNVPVRAFSFAIPGSGATAGKRDWQQVQTNKWLERYPSGQVTEFRTQGIENVEGVRGTVVRRLPDQQLEVFIPDAGASRATLYWRFPGSTQWNPFAEIGR